MQCEFLTAVFFAATITSSSENDGSSLEWSKEGSVRGTGHHSLASSTLRSDTCSPVAEEETSSSNTESCGSIRIPATGKTPTGASRVTTEGPVYYPTPSASCLMMPRPNSVAGTAHLNFFIVLLMVLLWLELLVLGLLDKFMVL